MGFTYAALAAKISNMLALVISAKVAAKVDVNAMIMPMRTRTFFTKYNAKIEAVGKRAANTVPMTLQLTSKCLSL